MTDLDRIPQRRLGARARNVRGVMHVAGPQHAFELSEVSAAIWRLADGRRTIREIGEAIAGEYEVERGQAASDAAELLVELEQGGVIELHPGSGQSPG